MVRPAFTNPRKVYHALDIAGRPPPHDLAAEREVLAACFASTPILDAILDMLQPREFYGDAHARAWGAMVSLRIEGRPVDLATVCNRLRERDDLESVGGVKAIADLASGGFDEPDAELVHAHALIVREMAHRRRIVDALQVQLGEAYSGRTSHPAFVEGVEGAVFNATRGFETASEGVDLASLVAAEEVRLGEIDAGRVSSGGLPFGLASLDLKMGGGAPGETTIVAGRPAMGKTSLLLAIARNVAASNHDGIERGVLIFSLEMKKEKLLHRMVAAESGVNLKRVIAGRFVDAGEAARAARARAFLAALPIVIDDAPGLTPARLRSRLRRAMMRFNNDRRRMSLVAVDQLSWMRSERQYGSEAGDRSREVGDILKAVVEIGKETDVHNLVANQLNRDVKGRSGKALRPRLTDLAESGQIEQHAHNVIAPHRPGYYVTDHDSLTDEQRRLVELCVLKQRDGATGIARLDWEAECVRFRSEAA